MIQSQLAASENRSIHSACLVILLHLVGYASGLAFLGPWPGMWLVWTIGTLFIWASVVDFRKFEIPDLATAGLTCAALYWSVNDHAIPWPAHVLGAMFWPVAFEAIRRVFLWQSGFDGLGFGDVKLMVPLALLCGPVTTAHMVLIAALSALGLILALTALRQRSATQLALPFGPFLCFSTWLIWVSGL